MNTPFATLKRQHEKAVERWARILSIRFHKRAAWLLAQIQRELPNVGALVYCNGESWLVPKGYPKHENEAELITYHNPRAEGDEPKTHRESMRHALDFANGYGDEPAVSARCLKHLRELDALAGYCEDSRLHTLENVTPGWK